MSENNNVQIKSQCFLTRLQHTKVEMMDGATLHEIMLKRFIFQLVMINIDRGRETSEAGEASASPDFRG